MVKLEWKDMRGSAGKKEEFFHDHDFMLDFDSTISNFTPVLCCVIYCTRSGKCFMYVCTCKIFGKRRRLSSINVIKNLALVWKQNLECTYLRAYFRF